MQIVESAKSNEQFEAMRRARQSGQSQEQLAVMWRSNIADREQRRAQFHSAFMTRFYPRAVAFRAEISERLGILSIPAKMTVHSG